MPPQSRIEYTPPWGENDPKHADARVSFLAENGVTRVTLGMILATRKDYEDAKGFGAEALGLQTLGKLARLAGLD